jgi:competence protein ComEC
VPNKSKTSSGLAKKWLIIPLVIAALTITYVAATMPDGRLHVSFLDVGQGDAILLRQGTNQVLIDGGPSPQALMSELGREIPFWDRTIELVVLTHPHSDHLAGLVEVLNRYRVSEVIYPDLPYESDSYTEWLRLIDDKGTKVTFACAGQVISLGEATLEVLNPQDTLLADTQSDIDNNSVVLRLERGQVSFLLTADIMQETELELVHDRADLHSTVLKVAHHGSDTSTSPEFLAVVDPQMAVISVGADNDYGHPSAEVVTRLAERVGAENIYRTDQDGTVEFITDGAKLWVEKGR